uniref:Allo60 n=1 Tax=Silurid herpesvirus 2 TaxID=2978071 RepID=A0A977TN99_9VIRU|nr:Allo60 [Silurid herpesvirus 2]
MNKIKLTAIHNGWIWFSDVCSTLVFFANVLLRFSLKIGFIIFVAGKDFAQYAQVLLFNKENSKCRQTIYNHRRRRRKTKANDASVAAAATAGGTASATNASSSTGAAAGVPRRVWISDISSSDDETSLCNNNNNEKHKTFLGSLSDTVYDRCIDKNITLPVPVVKGKWQGNGITNDICKIYSVALWKEHVNQRVVISKKSKTIASILFDRCRVASGATTATNKKKTVSTRTILKPLFDIIKDTFPRLDDSVIRKIAASLQQISTISAATIQDVLLCNSIHLYVGRAVDDAVKEQFAVKAGPFVSYLWTRRQWIPIASGLKVTGYRPADYRCNRCGMITLNESRQCHKTEIDAIAYDVVYKRYVLLEIKTCDRATVCWVTFNKYKLQTWLGHVFFNNVYNCSVAVESVIVFVDPCTMTAQNMFSLKRYKPPNSVFTIYPCLKSLCSCCYDVSANASLRQT